MKCLNRFLTEYVEITSSAPEYKIDRLYIGDYFEWDMTRQSFSYSRESLFKITYLSETKVRYAVFHEGEPHETERDRNMFRHNISRDKLRSQRTCDEVFIKFI